MGRDTLRSSFGVRTAKMKVMAKERLGGSCLGSSPGASHGDNQAEQRVLLSGRFRAATMSKRTFPGPGHGGSGPVVIGDVLLLAGSGAANTTTEAAGLVHSRGSLCDSRFAMK